LSLNKSLKVIFSIPYVPSQRQNKRPAAPGQKRRAQKATNVAESVQDDSGTLIFHIGIIRLIAIFMASIIFHPKWGLFRDELKIGFFEENNGPLTRSVAQLS
jgi:hypothetical protein